MYSTDIPAQNPGSSSNAKQHLPPPPPQRSGNRNLSNRSRDMSLIKSRGGYSMLHAGHHSADETGIATLGFSVKEQNGDRDRKGVVMRRKTKKGETNPAAATLETTGVTRMDDLGAKDKVKIRNLALIELTTIFDEHDVNYTRRKRKKRVKDHGWFGVPLQTLLDHDRKKQPHLTVPAIFRQLLHYLEKTGLDEEGILRVPGSVSRIKELRAELEEGFENGKFIWDDVRPNDAAGLLKQFLRELPIPLLTLDYIEAFAQVEKIPEKKDQAKALNLLALLLPDVHLETLLILLAFLKKVVDCQKNKMNLNNVAMIMAPNLFLVASSSRSKTLSKIDFHMAAGTATIVRKLIEHQAILCTVPPFMVDQIRRQYEAEQARKPRDKSIMKFLHKKDKSSASRQPAILNEADFNNRILQVHVPGKQGPTAVQLDSDVCVQQVLHGCSSAQGESLDSAKSMHLYEVGGNIGERRLDPRANMETLYRRNPNAEWTVKS